MGQPSMPPPVLGPPPAAGEGGGGCQVRCAGCRMILAVGPGLTEFVCPTCQLHQMLPPELMRPPPHRTAPSHGIDPTKIQLPCAHCKAILNVPHGLSRFSCPQCGVDLAVDVSKLKHFFPLPSLPPPEEVNEVAIEVEREEDEGGMVGETFTDYRPPKLSIGPPHPDPIVETSSLSAVQPPEPTYDLKITDELESLKALSCLQIETLVYACQRHLQHLQNGSRAGFFIGDGAGVGKGRTIAGLIWENWHHGRRKALWISVGSDLKFDARRDLDDVNATCIEVHALNKLPYSKLDSKSVGVREGVVFLTYSSLIASSEKGRSRLQQIVQWCGPEYDGLLVFDECHKAKNLVPEAGGQSTRTGEVVLEIQVLCACTGTCMLAYGQSAVSHAHSQLYCQILLYLQARLPEARVIYCSATGASEPRNMGYMVRLGLWGAGTCFSNFHEFLGALEKGGVGALELVAMDMKARGMYVCRTLSYQGVEFEIVEAPLEAKMMEMYKKAAEFWAELRVELLSASAFLSSEKPNSSQLWRLYWASHQRFFRHMCMSAKVPAVVRLAKQALTDYKCVVIGLQSTGEARTEEAVTKYGLELDDFVSGPRELLLKFVEENYLLPEKPESLSGDESVKELQRKRHLATPGVSFKGRVRKVAKWRAASDAECEEEYETDSGNESTESDDEFQICEICNSEEVRKKLLQCSCCGQLVHSSCLVPPVVDAVASDWACHSCKEKTEEYLQAKRVYIAEMLKRYEAAMERKSKILEIVRSLDLPNNPLDDIIDQLGGPDKVSEITGRRGMLVRASDGKGVTYQARNTKDVTMEMVNMHEKQLFMDGKKLVAIISEAGSAGVSLQADRRAINQRRRVHLTLELPWSADRAIQQFGRTHRSNQASAPEYRLIFTNLGGERRFASIVAKRLESLGALTQGDRRAGPSLSAYNYDSTYGKKALMVMYRGIMEQDSLPVLPPGCSFEKPDSIQEFILKGKAALVSVGIVRDTILGNGRDSGKLSGRIIDSDMHDVGRFLNRLLGLPPEIQNRLFELFVSILELLIQNARTEGHFDSGIVDMKANNIELQWTPKTVHVDHMSGASTVLCTFTMDRGITWESASALLEEKKRDGLGSPNDGFYESKREWLGRRHFLLAFEGSTSGMYKIFRPAVGEALREMPLSELKSKYRKISALEKARTGWEDEYEVSSKQCMHGPNCKLGNFCTVGRRLQEVNVLGGLILPVWGTIEKALAKQARQSHKRLRVVRIVTTTDNQRIVGLLIPNAAVESVLQDLAWVQDIND
ncbi:protein FORGETTER 1-like isoform X1 [Actinidia eriantha]|uniref:protein FORGETTER 1-like isoform X1 n=1 Tax=Actinidia eriantha TaxID=165200 RepID=UPI00258937A7|nr:protein FORGETTER 1-like isoform X1 [Actinidia eriantha]